MPLNIKILFIALAFFSLFTISYCLEDLTKNCTGIQGITSTNFDFSKWDLLLKTYDKNGDKNDVPLNLIDYYGIYNDSNYKYVLCQMDKANVTGFTRNQWNAFWINAYNIFAVYAVLSNPCQKDLFGSCNALKSITQIDVLQPSFINGDVIWKKQFLPIGGNIMSLNDIENNQLRFPPKEYLPRMVELHVSIVCASVSCPNLRAEAYIPDTLEAQLGANAVDFLSNANKGASLNDNTLTLSPIFSWFNEDFMNRTSNNYPDLATFLLKYTNNSNMDVYNYVLANKDKVNSKNVLFFTYDWNLNGNINSDLCSINRLCISIIYFIAAITIIAIIFFIIIIVAWRKKKRQYDEVN